MAAHHHHRHARQGELEKKAPITLTRTAYTTISADFDGPVGGYTTIISGTDEKTEAGADQVTAAGVDQTTAAGETRTTHVVSQQTKGAVPNALPSSLEPSNTIDIEGHSTLAIATSSAVPTHSSETARITTAHPTDAAATSSATPASSPASSGTSAGTIAGIIIGVLGGILVVALVAFLLFNRRKKQLEQDRALDNEKTEPTPYVTRTASVYTARTSATAPRLSLRPVTEFNPTFNERRSSKGAGLMLATAGAAAGPTAQNASREKGGSIWERPSTGHNNNPENPFGNHAERPYTPTGSDSGPHDNARNPFDSPEHVVGMAQSTDAPHAGAMAAGAAAGAVAGTSLTRKASIRQENPSPLDLDLTMPGGPPSPTGTEFSMNSVATGQSPGPSKSAAAIAQAGGPPSTAVHRVQLDFNPSMEDEMDIRAGQLVRILHEYDDGWTLCIRLDRSKQGVVPRTCLSTRPVKPRPAGGPPGSRNGGPPINPGAGRGPRGPPGQRPMTPRGGPPHGRPESPMRPMNGRPQSPAQMRPQSPAQMRGPPAGRPPMAPSGSRPASPAGMRPQSPGPRQQRPQSPSGMAPRQNAPGSSPMNPNGHGHVGRKPVPGQAY